MLSPDEIARAAAGLSEAMREAIIASRQSWSGDRDMVHASGMTRKALRDRGIGHGAWCYLTPLGLAIRAVLSGDSK